MYLLGAWRLAVAIGGLLGYRRALLVHLLVCFLKNPTCQAAAGGNGWALAMACASLNWIPGATLERAASLRMRWFGKWCYRSMIINVGGRVSLVEAGRPCCCCRSSSWGEATGKPSTPLDSEIGEKGKD